MRCHQVPSFKRLANEFDVNIKSGLRNSSPIVLMRIFVQRRDGGAGVRRVKDEEEQAQPNIPIFGEDVGEDGVVVRGCRPVIEILNQGQLVFSSLHQQPVPTFLDEREHDVMGFALSSRNSTGSAGGGFSQGVSLLGDVMVTCRCATRGEA